MPAGAPVPNVPAVHPSKETSLSDAVSRTPQKSSSSSSKPDPARPSITPRSAAITAKINYVSPYKQTPRSTTSPAPRSNTSTPVSRANAPAPANANHFKDIVTRFNTTSDEKIPNPTNRIAANVAAATSLKNRKPQTWKANGAAELRKSGAAATDKGRSASAAPPSIRPARQPSSRPASAAAKGTGTTARSTATVNSRQTKAGRRLSTSSSTASSDHPSADKLLPLLQTSFTSRNTRARGRTTHRRSRSMEAPSPSAASMADNESDGASQPETNPPLHHRRSRSNLESTNGSPGIEIQLDPDLWRDFDKHPATQPNASSAGTMKTVAPPLVSAHGSRRSPQPTTRAKSPNLTAYISVPLAKSSPTLRSSRGNRLPPPTNTTSHASRQRLQPAKDSNAFQRGKSKVAAASAGERKERKRGVPPELETIDFEARRARIQNAFTLKESNEQQIRRARSNQSLKESDDEGKIDAKKDATMQSCIQEEDEETEEEQRMEERVEFHEQLEEQQQLAQQQQEQLALEQQQQEERKEWQRHQEQQEELERLERQRQQEQQEELERLERLEQHEQLQRLKREQQEQQEQLEQLKREQLKREQQERQERLEREQRELQERLKREHEMEQFRLEQQKQQEQQQEQQQQQQEEEMRNGNDQDSSDNIGTDPVFDFMAEAIMAKIQPPTEDTTAAAATETQRSRVEPEERELMIPGAWGANYDDEVDYRATERVDERSAYVTEPIDSPAGDQQDAWEDTSGEETTEAETTEIEAEVQDLVAETEVSSKTHEPVIEVEDEPTPPRPTRFSQFFMPEQYPYTAKRNRSSHSPSFYTPNSNRTSATPIAVVITPDSPTRPALYNATNMLRTRSVGWTTEEEGGEDDNSSDRMNGSVIISNQQQHDTRTRCNPSSNIPVEDVETPIVSPMSAVAHDDRRAIDSFYSRYDDHGEEVINRYVDDRSPSGTSSHQDYHDNGNRNNQHEDGHRDLHVDTGGDYTSCSEAPTPLSSLPPDSLYDYSCSEEATPLSALPRSSFLDLQLPEDDGWTTSSDFSPESDDRGETPTTPRQPTGVGASLPPTPPPKDRPPPPPEKDKPKNISPVPSSNSSTAPSLHHRSHAVSGSEPLGLAIHSIPAHYDFRPSSERMSSYNPDHYNTGPGQRPSLDSRSSLEQRPSLDQRASLDHRPSQDQYSQSRPSEDTKNSPPSSLSDSRRSSTLHAGSSIGPTVSSIEDPDQKRLRRRQHLLREIVDTESGFFRDMTVAVEIYKGSANACYSVTVDDVKVLFGNTDAVVQFSKSFLEVLKLSVSSVYVMRRSANGVNSSAASMVNSINSDEKEEPLTEEDKDRKTYVGEAFAEFMYAMEKVYGDYCKNHDAAAARLQQLETVPGIAIWLQECKACAEDLTNAWNLESLLIKPVQRVLKYPLLLSQLLECTPPSHPDYPALEIASKEMTFVAGRINEMKKRKDMVEKIVGRKRNESDIRHGITKGFARRAEKLRQSVGLSEVVVDDTYNKLFENYNMHYTQVEVVHRDIEIYAMEIQGHVQNFIGFALSFRQFGEVIGTRHYVTEAKWKRFDHMMREISTTYLQEHKLRVKKHAIEPLETLLKMNESPQIIMTKRNNKAVDYARYKAIKDRGDTPDKRTKELADAYVALNETLIEELPRLFHLTKKLVDAVLFNFIDLQAQWMNDWASKIKMTFMDLEMPLNLEAFVDAFATSFTYHESMLTKLSICNGSLNAMQFPTASLGSLPASTVSLDTIDRASPFKMSRPQTADDDATRGRAMSLDTTSPTSAPADCDHSERRHSGGASVSPLSSLSSGGPPVLPLPTLLGSNRIRASSVAVPPRGPTTAAPVGPQRSYSSAVPDSHAAAQSAFFERPRPRPSYTTGAPAPLTLSARRADAPSPSPPLPSAAFSSAMPMDDDRDRESDNPPRGQSRDSSRTPSRTDFRRTLTISNNDKAMFIAASLYEFHLESPRREAGFPYLNYVQGEVFDVIGVKGEIWLARNQDDRQGEIGWIWCKHFRRLSEEGSS